MNERTLLIIAALGASVVAYVVYGLMTRDMAGQQPAPVQAGAATAAERPKASPKPSSSRARRAPRARPPQQRTKPAGGPPPAVPMPKVSIEEAREDYDALMKELERELQRNQDTGKALANEHWVDYYRRGHEVMDPLRRYLSFGSDEDKKEVGQLDEDLRNLMAKLQRDPATLEPTEEE